MLSRWLRSWIQVARASFASVGLDRVSTRLGIALLLVSSLFFAANFADKAWMSYQVARQKQALLAQIAQTKQQIAQSSTELKYMHTRPYYVQAARAFGYVQPGDYQIAINTVSAPAQPSVPARHAAGPVVKPTKSEPSLFRRILEAIVPGL